VNIGCGGSATFDLSHALIGGWLGESGVPSTNKTLDDMDPSFKYSGSWTGDRGELYFQDTFHVPNKNGSSFTLSFKNSGVALFGSLEPLNGRYSVQVDDQPLQTFNSSYPGESVSSTLIFFQGGLDPNRDHTLTFTSLENNGRGALVDFAQVYSPDPAAGGRPPTTGLPRSSLTAIIVGAVIGGILLLALVVLFVVLIIRRRRSRAPSSGGSNRDIEPFSIDESKPRSTLTWSTPSQTPADTFSHSSRLVLPTPPQQAYAVRPMGSPTPSEGTFASSYLSNSLNLSNVSMAPSGRDDIIQILGTRINPTSPPPMYASTHSPRSYSSHPYNHFSMEGRLESVAEDGDTTSGAGMTFASPGSRFIEEDSRYGSERQWEGHPRNESMLSTTTSATSWPLSSKLSQDRPTVDR
jgi:hypothetical protein